MLFMMYCLDKPDSQELRLANRAAHLNYIQTLKSEIKLAGPVLDNRSEKMQGSLFILEADNIERVQQINANDPYQKAGLFSSIDIRPFKQVVGS